MDDLIEAFEAYQKAKKIYKKRSKNCLYDRSYFLSDEIEQVEKTKEALSKCFKSAVLEAVNNQPPN